MDKAKEQLKNILLSGILSLEFCYLLYSGFYADKLFYQLFMLVFFVAVFVPGLHVLQYVRLDSQKKFMCFYLLVIPVFIPLAFLRYYAFYKIDCSVWNNRENADFRQALDSGRDYMFAGKKVMVFVPHEDDDVLLMGGVLEQYVKYGSDVYVVFGENGDSGVSKSSYKIGKELGQVRANEAVSTLTSYGIPEKNIYFLGYGSTVFRDKPHLYNHTGDRDEVVKTVSGFDHKYATDAHPAYRDGEKITKNNLDYDYESLIDEHKPDVIFCVDYDLHPGHRAVSLSFESALGRVLQKQDSYRPVVYKGFAYSTALYANPDYYDYVNPSATSNPYDTDYMQETNTFMWSDRVRFPVAVNTLTHYVYDSGTIKKISNYESQRGDWYPHIKGIVNSDKVFWERKTDSLLYNASVTATSGNSQLLNDFMLFDCDNINDGNTDFTKIAGVWTPSSEDKEKKIKVVLKDPSDIESICLYDNPCLEDNVENAKIVFDDGSETETGRLNPNGSETKIPVNKKNVKGFEIVLIQTSGNRAGLSEIEAYGDAKENTPGFIKLMDLRGDFVYDYYLNGCDEVSFDLYRYNCDVPLNGDYKITTDNENASAVVIGQKLVVRCPKGQSCTIKITSPDGRLSDTVRLTNKRISRAFTAGIMLSEDYQTVAVLTGMKVLLLTMVMLVFILLVPNGNTYEE